MLTWLCLCDRHRRISFTGESLVLFLFMCLVKFVVPATTALARMVRSKAKRRLCSRSSLLWKVLARRGRQWMVRRHRGICPERKLGRMDCGSGRLAKPKCAVCVPYRSETGRRGWYRYRGGFLRTFEMSEVGSYTTFRMKNRIESTDWVMYKVFGTDLVDELGIKNC